MQKVAQSFIISINQVYYAIKGTITMSGKTGIFMSGFNWKIIISKF